MKKSLSLILIALLFFISIGGSLQAERDIDPPSYEPNEEKDHLFIGLDITGLSADGKKDWIYYKFPDFVYLDPNKINSNVSISSTEKLIDTNGDKIRETIVVGINSNKSGNVTARVILDTAAKFEGYRDFNINSTVQDSKYGNVTTSGKLLFGGNAGYYKHQEEDPHKHENNFADAVVKCPEGYICPEIPNPLHQLSNLMDKIIS